MNQKALIIVFLLFALSSSILINGVGSDWTKCFYTDHSPDKTLQARLGFLRRERGNCRAIFSVRIHSQDGQMKEQVYYQEHRCENAKTNDPYVLKHTSKQEDYIGKYEVCVQMLQNYNEETLIQIHLGEKLNPIIYQHSDSPLPLVQSQQLLELDMTIQSIKRSLVKSRQHYKNSQEKGNKLDAKITEMMELYQYSNIMQTLALVFFGFIWVTLAYRLKRK